MPQGSGGRVARIVAGAVGPVSGAVGWTIDRARAAGDPLVSRSEPSSCAIAALMEPTASVTSLGIPCATGVASTVQGAWSHVLEAEASEARALRASARARAEKRDAQRRADRREQRRAERRDTRERAKERAAERRKATRTAAARRKAAAQSAKRKARAGGAGWRNAPIVTWYGPGFYGNRTACGVKYTRDIIGVAHRTLPCGTLVEFKWRGITAVAPVIDRGPFASKAYVFDFSAAMACDVFEPRKVDNACFTRYDVKYRVVGKVPLKRYLRRQ